MKTIKYTGAEKNWDELSVTGKQSVWYPGWTDAREDEEADLLIATGFFTRVYPSSMEALNTRVTALEAAGPGGGGVSDGDKGDITVTGGVWSIDPNSVTNAKMADVATATIKGRATAGTGDPEDLTATQVRTLLNVANGATANSSDATLLARANHTGTQTASTISDFNSAARAQVEAELIAGTNVTITPGGSGATRTLTIAAAGAGGVADGDKGDITVSGSGATWTIDNLAVTSAKVATGIDAAKLADGSVSNTEFQYLNGVTSAIQTQLNDKLSSSAATTISATKAVLVAADKLISFDSAASDVPKLTTLGELNNSLGRLAPGTGLGTTGTVNLDLAALAGTDQQITATGNITFTTSNRAAGLRGRLRISAGGSTRTLTWPSWTAYGAVLPTSLASGKVLRVAWECTGTTDASVDAVAVESV